MDMCDISEVVERLRIPILKHFSSYVFTSGDAGGKITRVEQE